MKYTICEVNDLWHNFESEVDIEPGDILMIGTFEAKVEQRRFEIQNEKNKTYCFRR